MATPKQALPELQQSLEAPAQPVLCGMGLPELGHSDCGGCTVLTPWVPQNYEELELLRQVYYGGIEHEIRKDVWPFLLGHYTFGMSKKEMEQVRGACSHWAGEMGRWGHQGGDLGSLSPFPARKKHGRAARPPLPRGPS